MNESSDAPVLLSVQDGIAEIRFNRPATLNAIDVASAKAFRDAAEAVAGDAAVRVIMLTAAGRAFVAGGDLGYFRAAGEHAPKAARTLIYPIHAAISALATARQPVLASLHGAVAGAGMSIALAADLAIAADDAVFNMAYAKVANSPDCSASWTLPRLVGLRKAMEIMLLSDSFDAAEALRLNLVNRVVPLAELETETVRLARRLADSAPLAMQSIKRLLRESGSRRLADQLDEEAAQFSGNAGSADFREALDAFFEKRRPKFEGR